MPVTAIFSGYRKLSESLPVPLGIFGGTFDPVHYGHLRLAEEAMLHLGLGGVRWIPAGQPPHRGRPQVMPEQRLHMVERAIAGNLAFMLDSAEVEAASPSYTVHTLSRLRGELGPAQPIVLLVGADAFAGLSSWHRWREILELAHIAVSHRPGFPVEPASLAPDLAEVFTRHVGAAGDLARRPAGVITSFAMTQLAISATQIRKLLANGLSARYLLPQAVLDYIQTHDLYRNP